jgi:hypothetical protein
MPSSTTITVRPLNSTGRFQRSSVSRLASFQFPTLFGEHVDNLCLHAPDPASHPLVEILCAPPNAAAFYYRCAVELDLSRFFNGQDGT